jgi:hypothetical protein
VCVRKEAITKAGSLKGARFSLVLQTNEKERNMSEKTMWDGVYLCVEPNVFIAAEFKQGTGGEFVCITRTYPYGPNYPVLEKIRDITDAEWARLENLQFNCWYPLWHGFNRERERVSFMVLQGLPTAYGGAGQPSRQKAKGKVGV